MPIPPLPERPTLATLREVAATCRACPLWEKGTQTVFGEGAEGARVMLVGEQPGDVEDKTGRPFVGPAGKLLDRALTEAGIDRQNAYVTNTVKHFKWFPRGKRRMHEKPAAPEIAACRPWLDAELAAVRPRALVCLGATAAQALLGASFRVTQRRGEIMRDHAYAPLVMATIHPSSILRAPDELRSDETKRFIADLAGLAAALLTG
jgi:uracil-DNA glycosylase